MANDNVLTIAFLVVGLGSPVARALQFKRDSPPKRIFEVMKAIEVDRGWDVAVKYRLYKANLSPEEESSLGYGVAPSPDPSQELLSYGLITMIWPNGFLPHSISIIVELVPGVSVLSDTRPQPVEICSNTGIVEAKEKGSPVTLIAQGYKRLDVDVVQVRVIQALKGYNSSTLATAPKFKIFQETEDALPNGRPGERIGLPIGLYHPVFDTFLTRLDPKSDAVPLEKLADTLRLLDASQEVYGNELGTGGRTETLAGILSGLLGVYIAVREEPKTKPDGNISAPNGAHCMIMEVKNEIGMGGSDPAIQGAVSYSKYWGQRAVSRIRNVSCCPSFILAIAGPWFCVLGAVMAGHPIVQPLTPYLCVANNSSPRNQSNDYALARVFNSLSLSISDLFTYYASLTLRGKNAERFDPHVRHFTHDGNRVEFTYLGEMKQGKAVFSAETKSEMDEPDERDSAPSALVVKFSESYHTTAHRLLADAQLAPKLLFVSSEGDAGFMVAGRSVIVMEQVQGEEITEMTSIPPCVKEDVSRALKLLHTQHIVFGDPRHPNVIAVRDDYGKVIGGMLVDFDWCGEHGQATYPTEINLNIDWPEGVGAGSTMMMEHDTAMFGRLF